MKNRTIIGIIKIIKIRFLIQKVALRFLMKKNTFPVDNNKNNKKHKLLHYAQTSFFHFFCKISHRYFSFWTFYFLSKSEKLGGFSNVFFCKIAVVEKWEPGSIHLHFC